MGSTALPLAPQASAEERVGWSLGLRVAFRFLCCYWILCALPTRGRVSIFDPIPGATVALRPVYQDVWRAICPWIAIHIFHLSGKATTYVPTGSADTTLAYIQNLCYLALAGIVTIVWSVVDRKRTNYTALHDWLRVLVRYTLAVAMFTYGIGKILPLQFGSIGIGTLIEPYGQFSPMGVLWNFMGMSRTYTVFSGIIEMTGCVLLVFRRTTVLGAMVSAAALLNVVLLNFSYDISVKLASLNYLLMAIFLLSPEARRLTNVLLLNRATAPAVFRPLWPARQWSVWATATCQALFIFALFFEVRGYWTRREIRKPNGPLYGVYDVEKFVESGGERPALATESHQWAMVAIEDVADAPRGSVTIRSTDDSVLHCQSTLSAATARLMCSETFAGDATPTRFVFTYSRPNPELLVLQNDQFTITLRRVNASYTLLTRGFHWIQEQSFYR